MKNILLGIMLACSFSASAPAASLYFMGTTNSDKVIPDLAQWLAANPSLNSGVADGTFLGQVGASFTTNDVVTTNQTSTGIVIYPLDAVPTIPSGVWTADGVEHILELVVGGSFTNQWYINGVWTNMVLDLAGAAWAITSDAGGNGWYSSALVGNYTVIGTNSGAPSVTSNILVDAYVTNAVITTNFLTARVQALENVVGGSSNVWNLASNRLDTLSFQGSIYTNGGSGTLTLPTITVAGLTNGASITNLSGYGSAALADSTSFATAAQGTLAQNAVANSGGFSTNQSAVSLTNSGNLVTGALTIGGESSDTRYESVVEIQQFTAATIASNATGSGTAVWPIPLHATNVFWLTGTLVVGTNNFAVSAITNLMVSVGNIAYDGTTSGAWIYFPLSSNDFSYTTSKHNFLINRAVTNTISTASYGPGSVGVRLYNSGYAGALSNVQGRVEIHLR